MKRIIASLLLVALLVTGMAALTGCNGDNTDGNGNGGASAAPDITDSTGGNINYDGSAVTITFYHSMGKALQDVLNNAIEEFNKTYPNITIVHSSYGDYDGVRDQIKTEIPVGNQPNIAYCYPDHVALYNKAGAVQTLDDLIADTNVGFTQAQLDDFIEGFYEEGRAFGDGKMYSLPLSKSTEVLYYNKTFFDQHGLTVPTTWEQMEAVCRQIKTIDPESIPLGYDSESNWFITMCEQYGSAYTSATGENFLFDNDTNKAFVAEFREWYQDGLVTTESLSGGYTSNNFKDPAAPTRSYMCIGSSAGAGYQKPAYTTNEETGDLEYLFEVGITSIPQVNVNNPKVISQGPSVCIFKKSNAQEVIASWLFVKFLTTNVDFQAGVSMSNGYMPVIKSVSENEIYKAFLADISTENLQAYAVKVSLEQEKAYYASPAFNGSSIARDKVGLLLAACLSNPGLDIDEAFADIIDTCKTEQGK